MSLVEAARAECASVVASVFVNPTQFGPNEDLARYPRPESQDLAMLQAAGVALAFLPTVEVMYPEGNATRVRVGGIAERLEGASRPGHFDGVATVVTKLFNLVQPDRAYFGRKDAQQLAVIRQMVRDLDMNLEIAGVPTVREADGLALSSRNAYLSAAERQIAPELHRSIAAVSAAVSKGSAPATSADAAVRALLDAGFAKVDYVEVRDATTLGAFAKGRPGRVLAAAWLGKTRLIDNVAIAS